MAGAKGEAEVRRATYVLQEAKQIADCISLAVGQGGLIEFFRRT